MDDLTLSRRQQKALRRELPDVYKSKVAISAAAKEKPAKVQAQAIGAADRAASPGEGVEEELVGAAGSDEKARVAEGAEVAAVEAASAEGHPSCRPAKRMDGQPRGDKQAHALVASLLKSCYTNSLSSSSTVSQCVCPAGAAA